MIIWHFTVGFYRSALTNSLYLFNHIHIYINLPTSIYVFNAALHVNMK